MNPSLSVTIPTAVGPLAGLLHLPSATPAPVVVCCHGMLSSKESQKFAMIAQEVCGAGAVALRFDFSGCGQSKAVLGASLLASRIRDLHAVLEYVKQQSWSSGRIGLIGSSLGGYLSLVTASSGRHQIDTVVCWATPFNLGKIKAAMDSPSGLSGFFPPGFCLGTPEHLEHLSPIKRVLVIHGRSDEVVPWSDGIAIYRKLSDPRQLLLVEKADHRFVDPACRKLALDATLQWLNENEFWTVSG